MKSSNEDLRKRGFITKEDICKFQHLSDVELMSQINSQYSFERSVAVNLLANRLNSDNPDFIKVILKRLSIERCLYTKIEICNALEKGGVATAEQMIDYLGCIGKNQHTCLPKRVSEKKSYPLPRDIIARSLGRMDSIILPVLFEVLNSDNEARISEVIDAIGFLLFYNPICVNENYFIAIIDVLNKYIENDLIVWKCVCCLSAFSTKGSIEVLNQILNKSEDDVIRSEVRRSLKLIAKNFTIR